VEDLGGKDQNRSQILAKSLLRAVFRVLCSAFFTHPWSDCL